MLDKKKLKRISIDLPETIVDKIDRICEESFISRRKWFIDAAQDKLEKYDLTKIDMLVRK